MFPVSSFENKGGFGELSNSLLRADPKRRGGVLEEGTGRVLGECWTRASSCSLSLPLEAVCQSCLLLQPCHSTMGNSRAAHKEDSGLDR